MRSHSSKVALFTVGWLCVAGAIGTGVYLGSGSLVAEVDDYSLVRLGADDASGTVQNAADAHRVLGERAAQVSARQIALVGPGGVDLGSVRLGDLGASVDLAATQERVERAARRERLKLPLLGVRPATQEEAVAVVAPVIHLDPEVLNQKALALKDRVDVAPVDAKLDLDAHRTVPEQLGHALDVSALIVALEAAATAAFSAPTSAPLAVPTIDTEPKITSKSADAIDVSVVVSEFETHFSRGGEQSRRGENIDRAASKLEGLVLPPNQVVSFNAVVGDRSEANGFKKSWEIFKGEMVEGIGGGTCQVASTIHAASFFGGIDVLERSPHSRPSAYIAMGLDSTVVYPSVDLKLRNPYPFPVVVHTKTTANTLKVELLGKTKPVSVKFSRDMQKRLPFTRKLVEDPALASNRVVHKQHGIDGYRIKRFRDMTFADGTHKVEETSDFYPPTLDIYEVPVGFSESRLPSIPQEGDEPVVAVATTEGSTAHSAEGATTAGTDDLVIVDGKGAHAPNHSQLRPEARLRMGR